MHSMGDSVLQTENQMGEITETVNDLVDAHEHTEDEQWKRAKTVDLE